LANKDDKDKPEEQADRQEEVFLREVDDAVREDDFKNFAQRYGVWIIAVVAIGLVGLAGWIFYSNDQTEESGLRSEEYVAAVDSVKANNIDGAVKALEPLEKAEHKGYRAAAKLMQANIALEQADPKKAVAGYKAIVADEDLPKPFRDLALIRQTASEFDSLKPQQVVDRLKPLAVPGNPWFGSAGEMVAIAYLNMGKNDLAGPLFAQLAKYVSVPASIQNRAFQMAGGQGIDAFEFETDEAIAESEDATSTASPASEGATEE